MRLRCPAVILAFGLTLCGCGRPKQGGEPPRGERAVGAAPSGATKEAEPNADSSHDTEKLNAIDVSPKVRQEKTEAQPPSKPKRVEYKPGIVLDFAKLQVEVASQVILRQGELELLAWSKAPVPKGHETILMVDAKPSEVYEALGLIGLTPGSPPGYDAKAKKPIPATGDRVDVFTRYEKDGRGVEQSICDWAIDKSREAPMAKRSWVFCGSYRTDKGVMAADVEGTLVTVVDFPSSLLSLAETHSESNADLWLVANRDAIPKMGTPVTLILRAAKGETK